MATELITQNIGTISNYEVHIPIGKKDTYPNTSVWITSNIQAGIAQPINVTNKVLVANNNGRSWEAFDTTYPDRVVRTIFET